MKGLIRFRRSFPVGWKRSSGVVLLAFVIGTLLSRSIAAAGDTRPAMSQNLSNGACSATATTLCLNDNRFSVAVSWRVPDEGRSGDGEAVPLSGDTGLFWFFDPSNIELVVKVLDGTGVNGSHWVFYAGLSNLEFTITVVDLKTGRVKTYDNPKGSFASFADTSAFADTPGTTAAPAAANEKALEARSSSELYRIFEALSERARVDPKTAAPCAPGGATLCLAGSRFQVTVDWEVPSQGRSGHGVGVPISTDTGYFWFSDDANVELAVKVLDGRPINGHFWIFVAALSNVKYTVTVTDTQTGHTKAWDNPDGQLASWADTEEFSDSAPPPPPPQGLGGRWTGTIAFFYAHDFTDDLCRDTTSFEVDLVESGGNLTGQFALDCGAFVLDGLFQGTVLYGSMVSPQGTGTIVAGSVSPDAIQFWTTESFYYHEHDDATHNLIRVSLRR